MLYPIDTATRQVKELNGIWEFRLDDGHGIEEKWYEHKLADTIKMPVPASYNDIYEDAKMRDHIGAVWYEREVVVPLLNKDMRNVLRIGAATHNAKVYINGKLAVEHVGGYTPFECDITELLWFGEKNRITIVVDNILDLTTVPIGQMQTKLGKYKRLKYYFDFFNYSGIHRPVKLYTTPKEYIEDVVITTDIKDNDGYVSYDVTYHGGSQVKVLVLDANSRVVATGDGRQGTLLVESPELWQPCEGYLYTMKIKLVSEDGETLDVYDERFGIRTVEVKGDKFLINGSPFYFKGFGKHEDSYVNGRGYNEVLNVKDFSLLKWIGANSFRTSHYPYSEEMMRLADEEGIVVIDESPAVGINIELSASLDDLVDFETGQMNKPQKTWSNVKCSENHLKVMNELITRDKNHPCVVMWSVANEPASEEEGAYEYFKTIVDYTRELDPTRPVTIAEHNGALPMTSKVTSLVDVVALNRYYGWYLSCGNLDMAQDLLVRELMMWWEMHKKPIIMSEYGTDTILGLTSTTPAMWTEEYQQEFLRTYHKVFDQMHFVVGEHVWNFADFATGQEITRVQGNKKGIFTRERRPKKAAYTLKERWRVIPDFNYKS